MLALVLHGELIPDPNSSAASANQRQLLQHYGPETYNKNFIYSGDSWLFVERWEHLIANRAQLDIVQVLTWSTSRQGVMISVPRYRRLMFRYLDDYGESHYIGPIQGAQPMSEAWVNGFDHQGISSSIPRFRLCLLFAHVWPRVKRLA
jgi:glucan endo-1,3-alpha-glucosidase